jgi:hypothetical protein
MFWKKPPLAEAAPFDEDSYVPEPTDHFGNSTRTLGTMGMIGSGVLVAAAILRICFSNFINS